MSNLVVGVDMDGTIVEHFFPEIGPPVPGAIEWMKRWQAAGAELILWTMRSDGRVGEGRENDNVLSEAVEYCRMNGIEFYGINTNPTQASWTGSPKAYCHLYVDDAAYGCPLIPGIHGERPMVDWSVVGPAVMKLLEE